MSWLQLGSPNGAIQSVIANQDFFYAVDQATQSLFACIYDQTVKPLDWRWQKVGDAGSMFATGSSAVPPASSPISTRVVALTPNRDGVEELSGISSGTWGPVGGPAHEVFTNGLSIWASTPDSSDLWVFNYFGEPGVVTNEWMLHTKGLGPGTRFVVDSIVAAQPADRSAVYLSVYKNGSYQLQKIGGPADAVFVSGATVYAAAPGMQALWEYSDVTQTWKKIGGPASMWTAGAGGLFGLTPAKDAVYQYQYNAGAGGWTKVGGPAGSIFAGATPGLGGGAVDVETAPSSLFNLFATAPDGSQLWGHRVV